MTDTISHPASLSPSSLFARSIGLRAKDGGVQSPSSAGLPSGFGSVLARRQSAYLEATADGRADGTQPEATPRERARRAAQDFVAVSLIEPVLKNLRETSQAAAPFGPGAGEKQFRQLADAQVARQIARATRFPLVESIAANLLRGVPAAEVSDGATLGRSA
ncbi:MAG: hypothetical protein ACT4PL_05530 [Phycisphaerales bacterium]